MKILIACEFSGVIRRALRKQGHDAWSCDILPSNDNSPHHIQDNVLNHLEGWDAIIAHPPCTKLTRAGTRWLFPKGVLNEKRYKEGLEAKEFFMKLYNAPCPIVVIENPVPHKVFELPPPSQIIQPCEYGHALNKTTYLWIRGNLPKLKPTNIVKPEYYIDRKGIRHSKLNGWSAKKKSITFEGVADAIATQWFT